MEPGESKQRNCVGRIGVLWACILANLELRPPGWWWPGKQIPRCARNDALEHSYARKQSKEIFMRQAGRAGRFVLAVVMLAGFSVQVWGQENPRPVAAKTAATRVGQPQQFPTIQFEKYKLANGLEVILSEDHRLPLVAVDLWYHVGPSNERPGRTGFAHLFEHMMFQGSKHVQANEHFRLLESAGATDVNGTTDFDRTNYFETLPANQLELGLWLESD